MAQSRIFKLSMIPAAALLLPFAGCSGGGSGGGGSSGGIGSALSGIIGQKNADYVDAGTKVASAVTMSDKDEDELGRAVAIAATNQWPLYDKPELTKYVTLVGLTLADGTSRPDANWTFGVLDTPEIGAYSGPNGYILVTRGAIAAMEDESELAAVLAHEIAHVLNHDGMNAVKNAKLTEAALQAGTASDQRAALFKQATGDLANKVLKSGWSQGQETEADRSAVQLMIAAGYDPTGMPRFLHKLQAKTGAAGKPFGTHPGTADRIARTTAQIGSAKAGATNRDRFAKATAEARL